MRFSCTFLVKFVSCVAIFSALSLGCGRAEPGSPADQTAKAAGLVTAAAVTTAAAPVLGPAAPVAGWLAGETAQMGLSWLLGLLLGGAAADRYHKRKNKKAAGGKPAAGLPDLPDIPTINPYALAAGLQAGAADNRTK